MRNQSKINTLHCFFIAVNIHMYEFMYEAVDYCLIPKFCKEQAGAQIYN